MLVEIHVSFFATSTKTNWSIAKTLFNNDWVGPVNHASVSSLVSWTTESTCNFLKYIFKKLLLLQWLYSHKFQKCLKRLPSLSSAFTDFFTVQLVIASIQSIWLIFCLYSMLLRTNFPFALNLIDVLLFFFVYREGKLLLQDNANTGRTETVQLYLFNTCLLLCRTSTKSGKWELRVLIRMNNAIRYKEEGSCTFRNLFPFKIVLSIFHCIYIGILFQL